MSDNFEFRRDVEVAGNRIQCVDTGRLPAVEALSLDSQAFVVFVSLPEIHPAIEY